MKQQFKTWIGAAIFLLAAITTFGQTERTPVAAWASDKGYWVVESNNHSPLNHIIRFYTNENMLVYTEKISGIKLNLQKRKVKMKLKEVLETTMLSWQKNKQPEANKDYVTALFR